MSKVNVQKLYELTGHKGSIYTIERGLSEEQCISGAADGMVVLWNQKEQNKGKLVASVPGSVYALHTIVEEKTLVIGQNHEGIHLINLETNKEFLNIKLTDESIFDIKRWGDLLIVACGKGELIFVNYKVNKILKRLKLSDKNLRSISIHKNSKECVVGCSDHSLKVVDLEKLELKKSITGHSLSVFPVVYSPDSAYIISGSRDAQLKVWDVSQDYKEIKSIAAHVYPINHISFHPDGKYFATCSMDKTIKIWDYETLKLLKVIDKTRHDGHSNSINKLFWSSSEAYQLMACSDDRTISHWKLEINL